MNKELGESDEMESEAAWEVFEAWWLDEGKKPEAPSVESLVRFLEDQNAAVEPLKELRKFLDALGRAVRMRGLEDVTKVDAVVATLEGPCAAQRNSFREHVPAHVTSQPHGRARAIVEAMPGSL